MAKKNGNGFLSTVGIIAGSAILGVVATRVFDKYLAEKIGLGGGDDKKALPPSDEPGPQTPHVSNPGPYGFGGLQPLPPPQLVPVPFTQFVPTAPPWMQQPQQPPPPRAPVQRPAPVVNPEPEDPENDNVVAFLETVGE